jgi:hypothetical protein
VRVHDPAASFRIPLRETAGARAGFLPVVLGAFAALAAGIASVAVADALGEVSSKLKAGFVLVALVGLAAGFTRRVKESLLFAWIFTLTYNRQFFSFEAIVGSHGFQGPYWIVSDVFLVGLLVTWVFEAAWGHRAQPAQAPPMGRWLLPFAAAAVLSVLVAARPEWTLFEMLRLARVAFVLAWCRYNLGRRQWWVAAAALLCGMAAQATLGTIEVASRRSGVLWLVGLGGTSQDETYRKHLEIFGWMRATATMNHPPVLACYLMLVIPMALALGLTVGGRALRALSAAIGVVGLVGLGATLSRWPWALMLVQVAVLAAGLVALGLVPARRIAGILSVAGFALLLAVLPLLGFLEDRFTRDWGRSVEFRTNAYRVGMAMIADHPFLGVGLNNSRYHILRYDPEQKWMTDLEDKGVHEMKVRFLVTPENGFLFPFIETGVVGFLGFLVYLAGGFRAGLRALGSTSGAARGACLGLLVGMAGLLAEQAVDSSFWVDPVFYSFALVIALLNGAAVTGVGNAPPRVSAR